MTKKAFLVLCLCILTLSCVFAGKFSLVGQVSPFALQSVNHTSGKYNSTYGLGFNGGVRYEVYKGITAGVDLGIDLYKYDELETDYTVMRLRAVGGYTYNFNEKFFASAELGVGMDGRRIGEVGHNYFAFGADLRAGYVAKDDLKVTAGVGMDLALQKGASTKSTDLVFRTSLGVIAAL